MIYRPQPNMPPLDANLQHNIDQAQMRKLMVVIDRLQEEVRKRDDEIAALKEQLDTLQRLAVQVHGTRGDDAHSGTN